MKEKFITDKHDLFKGSGVPVVEIEGFGRAKISKILDLSIDADLQSMCAINSMTRHGPTGAVVLDVQCGRCRSRVSLVPVD